uniref:Ribonuclease H-like domain-containing protein n=1 Tax=Tanacetum cinerariifolium TaxID=118510 RepID=A0A6L2J3G2_TANCI|nr:ribonuclease H-like domain-containing protein [Tanacetum cinerariifolium]
MVTRFCVGTNRPTKRYACHVSPISPLPKSSTHAFNDPHWYRAMLDEYNALIKNKTWILVPRPHNVNIVRCLWLFWHKHNADGSLNHYKARLVANGSSQLTASSTAFLQQIITSLYAESSMTDLGPLNYFLGVSVTRDTSRMFLSQQKYAIEVLEHAGMFTCTPCRTSVDTDSKLYTDGDPVFDPTLYRSLVGALQYLTFTRPDISYAVQQVCLFMHDPREPYFLALKRILRYVSGTLSYGLQLYSSTTSTLVAYSNADWAACPTTRRSTSGYCVFLGNNLLSWSFKRQFTISRSSAEAEYRGVANAVAETCWLCNLLRELYTPLSIATLVYCDNVSAVYLSSNLVQHQRTKHIEIEIHFVRDLVSTGRIRVIHVPSHYQYADVFTKGLPTALFDEFRSSLSVRSSPAQTAGGFTTKDGYILSMQRIPAARGGTKADKPPVLLQHGLLMDGGTWVLNSPDESLGFILADNGFDVWIANTRGTNFSRGHASLIPSDPAYWEWSWDELVAFDLPSSIQYRFEIAGYYHERPDNHSLLWLYIGWVSVNLLQEGSHEIFQCQPITQNIDFSGSDQIQTPQYPEIHLPSQEISDEVFQANHSVQNEESLENFSNEIVVSDLRKVFVISTTFIASSS